MKKATGHLKKEVLGRSSVPNNPYICKHDKAPDRPDAMRFRRNGRAGKRQKTI